MIGNATRLFFTKTLRSFGIQRRVDMPDTGASALVTVAAQCGVEVCFCNPGTTEMHLVGAFEECPIRAPLCLHENVCTGAADGWSRIRPDSVPMTLLHLGPGLMNGLSNLHNAKRARSPVVNVVGDMSTFHRGADALLESDIESLARVVSAEYVHTSVVPNALPGDVVDAIAAAANNRGVATLVVPHDRSWETVERLAVEAATARARDIKSRTPKQPVNDAPIREFLAQLVARAHECAQGEFVFYIGGQACRVDELRLVGAVARALGADIMCENAFAAIERGRGNPHVTRTPYFPKDASSALGKYKVVATLDAKTPVSMFGYKNTPSRVLTQHEDDVWELDPLPGMLTMDLLRMLAEEVERVMGSALELASETSAEAQSAVDVKNAISAIVEGLLDKPIAHDESMWECGMNSRTAVQLHQRLTTHFEGVHLISSVAFQATTVDALAELVCEKLNISATALETSSESPTSTLDSPATREPAQGTLTGEKTCRIIAECQPANCVIVDESLTSGTAYWDASAQCESFTHMTLTGGSIGFANAVSIGVAIAAPHRRVISMIGDGSAQYTVQALWTQAREKLDIVTVIFNNASYQILKLEMAIQGVRPNDTSRALTELSNPTVDWVSLGRAYGVKSVRASTADEFRAAFKDALNTSGPVLIDAVLSM